MSPDLATGSWLSQLRVQEAAWGYPPRANQMNTDLFRSFLVSLPGLLVLPSKTAHFDPTRFLSVCSVFQNIERYAKPPGDL